MVQTAAGRLKVSARVRGVSVAEYKRRTLAGLKHCATCKRWRHLAFFHIDSKRYDGRAPACRECTNQASRDSYQPRPRPSRGRRYVRARDRDRKQARRRVNYLVEAGILAHPNGLPCADCGHTHTSGRHRRHEYHHANGYAAPDHERVIVVCTKCHAKRERIWERRARENDGTFAGKDQ